MERTVSRCTGCLKDTKSALKNSPNLEMPYSAFTTTSTFSDDIRVAVQNAQNPFLYVEGTTDGKYLRRAAQLLDKEELLKDVEIKDGQGIPGLKNIWGAVSKLSDDLVPRENRSPFRLRL